MIQRFYRNALYASTALTLISIGSVDAQDTLVPGQDTLVRGAREEIELSADKLTYDAENGEVRALGMVTLVRDGYTLLAGEIRYSEKTGIAEAIGAVELITPAGERIITPRLTLNNALKTAFVEDFRLLLTDGSQVAAESGSHDDSAGQTSLNRAVYSPCKVCEGDPNDKPAWQIKAVKVTHDREKRRLYYKNAFLEILGVPVAWAPSFSHPDPTVEKASGFLPFKINRRNDLGVVVSAPYYHVIDDSRDFTITPTITTQEGPVLSGEYRQHIGNGKFTLDGSITYADRTAFPGTPTDPTGPQGGSAGQNVGDEFRGHFHAEGTVQHAERWRSEFDVAWTSDDTYLRRYDFSDVDTLKSEYKIEGFFDRSYVAVRTIGFQGLRQEDIQGLTAFALPLVDAEYIPDYKPLGGTVKLKANAVSLQRFEGLDTQRVSTSASWEKRTITPKGFVVDTSALLRGDIYNVNDIDRPDDPAFSGTRESDARLLARLNTRVSWPLVKESDSGTHTLEPILELTVSPERGALTGLVNEDSRAFELSELNIFSAERTSGYDLWEEGTRATYGLSWRFDGTAVRYDFLFGQSIRITGETVQFPDGTGLEGDYSDFVGHTRLAYKDWVDFEHRYRLDDKTLDLRRSEAALRLGPADKWGITASHFYLDRDLGNEIVNPTPEAPANTPASRFINREDREELRLSGFYQIDENWRISALTIQNLTDGRDTIEYGGEISYGDECIEFGLEIRENFTVDRDFNPGTQILFRLKLRNLG